MSTQLKVFLGIWFCISIASKFLPRYSPESNIEIREFPLGNLFLEEYEKVFIDWSKRGRNPKSYTLDDLIEIKHQMSLEAAARARARAQATSRSNQLGPILP